MFLFVQLQKNLEPNMKKKIKFCFWCGITSKEMGERLYYLFHKYGICKKIWMCRKCKFECGLYTCPKVQLLEFEKSGNKMLIGLKIEDFGIKDMHVKLVENKIKFDERFVQKGLLVNEIKNSNSN